jgi:hypothetical protein
MNVGRDSFRTLYDELLGYQGTAVFDSVLKPWIEASGALIAPFAHFRRPCIFDPLQNAAETAMWSLYALSRVNDVLLLALQAAAEPRTEGKVGFSLHVDDYAAFFEALGFDKTTRPVYAAFYHEIVRVDAANNHDTPISIQSVWWPGLVFGDMLFSRSGVTVSAGQNVVNKAVAETSVLYFSHRRLKRHTSDLSIGWGSNSQWRTSFRRDYDSNGMWIYNIDGINALHESHSAEPDRDGLTPAERIELCRNRCFVVTDKPDADLWPYDDRFEELRAELLVG